MSSSCKVRCGFCWLCCSTFGKHASSLREACFITPASLSALKVACNLLLLAGCETVLSISPFILWKAWWRCVCAGWVWWCKMHCSWSSWARQPAPWLSCPCPSNQALTFGPKTPSCWGIDGKELFIQPRAFHPRLTSSVQFHTVPTFENKSPKLHVYPNYVLESGRPLQQLGVQ